MRETGEFISQEIKTVMESLKSECIRVVGVVADNARNMQKGIVLTIPEGVLQLNCFAHTLNLLLKDVAELFAKQFEQANHTEEFFRNRHQAHSAYEGAKQTLGGPCSGRRLTPDGALK